MVDQNEMHQIGILKFIFKKLRIRVEDIVLNIFLLIHLLASKWS